MKKQVLSVLTVTIVLLLIVSPLAAQSGDGVADNELEGAILDMLNQSDDYNFDNVTGLDYESEDGTVATLNITAQGTDGSTYDITLNSSLTAPSEALETYPADMTMRQGGSGMSAVWYQAFGYNYDGDVPPALSAIAQNARWAVYPQGEGFTPAPDEDATPGPGTGTPSTPGTSTPPSTWTPEPTATNTPQPTTTNTPQPTATPPDDDLDCPSPSTSQRSPRMNITGIEPPKPIVVGQGGSGGTIHFRAVSFPVIHDWWTEESETWEECLEWGWDGSIVCVDSETHTREWCEHHREVIRDPVVIDECRGTAELRNSSIAWIRSELQQKYPGAEVKHPNWQVGCSGSAGWNGNIHILEGTVQFDFEDPGKYNVAMHARTQGTTYTAPRSFGYVRPDPLNVYLMDSSLTE